MLTGFIQNIVNGLGDLGHNLVATLPTSPFAAATGVVLDSKYLSMIAWVIPIPQIVSLLQLWIIAIATYYLAMIVMRWVKMIS